VKFDDDDSALVVSMCITVACGIGCLVVAVWAIARELGWMA
jgi:hypothetical protein